MTLPCPRPEILVRTPATPRPKAKRAAPRAPATSLTVSSERVETERFTAFTYDEQIARDKANLDIIWLRDESLDDVRP